MNFKPGFPGFFIITNMENNEGRITGFGGVFVKYNDPEGVLSWYKEKLGLKTDEYGTSFEWRQSDHPEKKGYTVWSAMDKTSEYFQPSEKEFMINLRVVHIEAFLARLKQIGIEQLGEIQEFEYGKFAHILDPEGVKIELWEANDENYDKMIGEVKIS
ncbi:MAG: glyoxalase/bleomycin resistance protein/dioxygenase [Bacteroidetes bacterium]|nr:MAG: glyoxalase/bleomycin resistance protein/dioxygenase [Bacteroidota bacterium]